MRQCNGLVPESFQQLVGVFSNLTFNKRYTQMDLEPLWLRHAEENLIFFDSLINASSYISAPKFRIQTPQSLLNTKLVITTDSKNKH